MIKSDATKAGRLINIVVGAADSNMWAFAQGEMAHDEKHAGISKDHICDTPMKSDSPVTTMSGVKLRSEIHEKVKSAVEAAQQKGMGSMSRNLFEEIVGDFIAAVYLTAAEDILKITFFVSEECDNKDNISWSTSEDVHLQLKLLVTIWRLYEGINWKKVCGTSFLTYVTDLVK